MRHAVWIVSMNVKKILLLSILSAYLPILAKGNHTEQQRSIENITIDLNVKDVSLSEVFRQITKSTKIRFSYKNADLEHVPHVSIKVEKEKLQQVLNQLTNTNGLEWEYLNDVVVIRKTEKRFPNDQNVINLDTTVNITGVVRDPENRPIPGVSISVKGAVKGVTTNNQGQFYFTNVPKRATLVFSSIGFVSQERKIGNEENLSIIMHMDIKEIEAVSVVSTGYQDIPKERATGSFYKLDNELISRSVSTNILDRLIGVTSGLNFEAKNFNSTSQRREVSIRGVSTINANQRPLIVIDGFPYEESDKQYSSFMDWISNVNPNDIESVTVLKDASAASIWGARSGNGVIVITTKKGKFNQRTKVQFNSNVTIGEKPDLFYVPTLSSSDFLDFEIEQYNKGFYNAALNNNFTYPVVSSAVEILANRRAGLISSSDSASQIDKLRGYDLRNDLNRYMKQTSVNQQYALNISGGSAMYSYYTSMGYDRNRASDKGTKNDRVSFRFDNTFKPFNKLNINAFISYVQSGNGSSNTNVSGSPYLRLADEKGTPLAIPFGYSQRYLDTARYPALLDWRFRPIEDLDQSQFSTIQYDMRLGGSVKYTIINGVSAEIKYQYQKTLTNYEGYYSSSSYYVRNLVNRYMSISRNDGTTIIYPVPNGGIKDRSANQFTNWNFRYQLNYNKRWKQNDLVAIAGIETRESLMKGTGADRIYGYDANTGTISTQINYDSIYSLRPFGSGSNRVPTSGNRGTQQVINRFVSYFANTAYTFREKYILSASARMDGSNFFGIKANQRILPLWSGGVAWNLSNESFYSVAWMPYLKLRLTYGYNGNMRNDATAYPTIRYVGNDANTGVVYSQVESPGNPQLRWERIRMINYGVDFSSNNNRVSGSLEYYIKKGIDLLGPVITDQTTGFSNFTGNRASIDGKGIDITINTSNLNGAFSWTTNLLLSYNTDKITAYEGAATDKSNKNVYFSGLVIGKPLDALYSYRWAGLDPKTGDPRVYVADTITSFAIANASAKPSDLVYQGPKNPVWFGSLRNNMSFKNITLSVNVLLKFEYYFSRSSINYANLLTTYSFGGHEDYLKRWKQPGDELITNIPSLPAALNSTRDLIYRTSDILVEKADHIRLQDIRLGYDLNRSNIRSLPFQNIQVYAYASNIGILWRANKYNIDPDYSVYGSIPNPRTIAFGINVSF